MLDVYREQFWYEMTPIAPKVLWSVYHLSLKGAIFFVINLIKMSGYHPLRFSK